MKTREMPLGCILATGRRTNSSGVPKAQATATAGVPQTRSRRRVMEQERAGAEATSADNKLPGWSLQFSSSVL